VESNPISPIIGYSGTISSLVLGQALLDLTGYQIRSHIIGIIRVDPRIEQMPLKEEFLNKRANLSGKSFLSHNTGDIAN
jgi:hypothetical protein